MNVFLLGYYGHGNAGDEVLRQKALWLVKRKYPKARLTGFFRANLVVAGGGSLLQDHTSRRSLYTYLAILLLAKLLRKRVVLMGHGFSPFRFPLSKKLTEFVLKRMDGISVRDHSSMRPKAILAADLAYLSPGPSPAHNEHDGIAVSVRSFENEALLRTFFKLIEKPSLFLDFQPPKDSAFFSKILAGVPTVSILQQWDRPQPVKAVIAMRYHACVWASLQGLPFLGLVYDDKVRNISEELGQEWVDLRHTTTTEMVEKWNLVNKKYAQKRAILLERTAELVARSRKNELVL